MKLTKNLRIPNEAAKRIPRFYLSHNYKQEESSKDHYRFSRGSKWVLLLLWTNVESCPTKVNVDILSSENNISTVAINYDVNIFGGAIFTKGDRKALEKELAELEEFIMLGLDKG